MFGMADTCAYTMTFGSGDLFCMTDPMETDCEDGDEAVQLAQTSYNDGEETNSNGYDVLCEL